MKGVTIIMVLVNICKIGLTLKPCMFIFDPVTLFFLTHESIVYLLFMWSGSDYTENLSMRQDIHDSS